MTPAEARSLIADSVTEKIFQLQVIGYAHLRKWKVYHTFDSRRSEPGFPDLFMVRGKRIIFAELKTTKGKLSPPQEEWLAALVQAPCEVYVWTPTHWNQIEDALA